MNMTAFKRIFYVLGMAAFLTACGAAQPEGSNENVVSVEDYETQTFTVEAGEGQVEGLLGNVTQDEIERVFGNNRSRLMKCYENATFDLEEIEGTLKFELEVPENGSVQSAFISESDLGSLETESCMLKIVKNFNFKRAPGGIAVLYYPLELEAPYAHAAFIPWSRNDVSDVVGAHRSEISKCLGGQKGVQLTAYIGQGGRVLAAGAAAETIEAYDGAICLAKAIRGWTFQDPSSESLAKLNLVF
jgi:hypothetical protein